MELVAMDMKQRGLYIARQLSFYGVAFGIEDVALSRDFIQMYNAAVRLVCHSRVSLHYFSYFTSLRAQCGTRGCTNRPAPFPGWMSYKATKPGSV